MNRDRKEILVRVACVGLWCALGGWAVASETAGWRTNGNGRFPSAAPLLQWAKDRNVLWSTPLPSWSNAMPVLADGKIFVCSEPDTLLCVNKADGKILWKKANPLADTAPPGERAKVQEQLKQAQTALRERKKLEGQARGLRRQVRRNPALKPKLEALNKRLAELRKQLQPLERYFKPRTHRQNGYSSPTPVSDGQSVYAVFGTGVVAAFDLNGKRKWIRFIEKSPLGNGHSASPLLVAGKLLVHFNRMIALNPETGEELWKAAVRPAWGTAAPARIGNVDVVITPKGDVLRVADGKVLAKGLAQNTYNGPLIQDGVAYFIDERGATAVQLPAAPSVPLKPKVLWTAKPKRDRYYASPLYDNGLLYVVTRYGLFSILDARSGQIVATQNLKPLGGGGQSFYPSPCLAGKHIFLSNEMGKTVVLAPGRQYKEIARNQLEPGKATPVFDGKRIYFRGKTHLYCIAK